MSQPSGPSISVVIPAYNIQRWLSRAVRSVLAQSVPPAEIIVVDDGSTDRTGQIADDFSPAVRCIHQPNAGLSAARNAGIGQAAGEFIAFLDGDDEWRTDHLANAAAVLAADRSLDWYCCAYQRRTEQRVVYTRVIPPEFRTGPAVADYYPAQARWTFCWVGTAVVRRAVFDDVGLFDESMRYAEDLDMWFRIALRRPAVGYCPRIGTTWWAREGSLSAVHSRTPGVLLAFVARYRAMAEQAGVLARATPLLARWLRTAAWLAVKAGDAESLARIAAEHGDLLPAPLAAACRMAPPALLRAAGSAKTLLKKMRALRDSPRSTRRARREFK